MMLHDGRRWVQPAKAAEILGMSPSYLKKLLGRGEVDGFHIMERKSENDRVFRWFDLDELLMLTGKTEESLTGAESREENDDEERE
jgi:hypothetical protein